MGISLSGGIGPLRASIPLTGGRRRSGPGLTEQLVRVALMLLALPVIAIYFAVKYGYPRAKRFYTHPDPQVRRKCRFGTAIVLTVLFAISAVSALAQTHFGDAVFATVMCVGLGYWAYRESDSRRSERSGGVDPHNHALGNAPAPYNSPPAGEPEPYQFIDTRAHRR
ncbi:hypothetical protein [Rhodococcus opacus]|uniref:Uncharacterized protein n=1 Tax=Rhodococcus opacus TaxID=37919 RepID=A0A076EYD0_RHOOP|nr:hypothetical protein [Rhodococcus opacus]AII10393.1 hypothetical protein EP51_39505 [Rhodococcus opacus]